MKKVLILCLLLGLIGGKINAQTKENKTTVEAGFTFNPQGGISLKKPQNGFKTFTGLLFIVPIHKNKITLIPYYQLDNNSVGTALAYDLNRKLSVYGVAAKNVLTNDGYNSVGAQFAVANGKGLLFSEIGTNWSLWNPTLFAGVFIPFTLKLKKE